MTSAILDSVGISAAHFATMLASGATRQPDSHPLQALPALAPRDFEVVRRRMMLECCKWDPQVGDVCTLAPFALTLSPATWRQLRDWSQALAKETLAAEAELLERPDLHRALAVPRPLRKLLRNAAPQTITPAAGRSMRFDFHWTDEGWRVSEVNSDVPGGFTEASNLPAMMAPHYDGFHPAGDPASLLIDALERVARQGCGHVALISAPGYMEDTQIVQFVARKLRERGCVVHAGALSSLCWDRGIAHVLIGGTRQPADVVFRFYQAEWCRRGKNWQELFVGGRTPVLNPPAALLTESKRFPLVWDDLSTSVPTWRALLPATRAIKDAPWRRDDGWVLKAAYSNNGDAVASASLMKPRDWRKARWDAFFSPGSWVAQRRFCSVPLATPLGPMHACLGVYVIDGQATGIYARLASRPVIDFEAIDVAVLLPCEERGKRGEVAAP